MFTTLSNMFSTIFDDIHAPAESHTPVNEYGVLSTIDETHATCDWTNGFGTLCDFEVPASSCDMDFGISGSMFG